MGIFELEPMMYSGFYPRLPTFQKISDELLEYLMTIEYETDSEYESDDNQSMDEHHEIQERQESNSESGESEKESSKDLVENSKNSEVSVPKSHTYKHVTNKVKVSEDLEKMEIQIELSGYTFKGEHLEVRVVDGNILEVKAEDGDQKYQK